MPKKTYEKFSLMAQLIQLAEADKTIQEFEFNFYMQYN